MTILWALLGGLCGRIRGGLLDDILGRELPNGLIRAVWALCVMALFIPPYWTISPLIFICAFIGVVPGYWGGKFDLSRKENRNWQNYLWLTIRGMFIALPLAVLMTILSEPTIWWAVAAGALFVPCYLLGNIINKYFPIQGTSQWGEWLLYGVIMCSMASVYIK